MTASDNKVLLAKQMTPRRAIRIIAREAIARGAEKIRNGGWEDFPEIGERDWEAICDKMQEIAPWPDHDEFGEAYHLLETRAEHS